MDTLCYDVDPCAGRVAVVPLKVIIIGAGIAGLTTGLALAQTGHSVTILESVPRITEVGAGLQLAPNASRILHRLGVIKQVMNKTTVLSRVSIRRYDSDEELGSSPLMPEIGQLYGAPMGVIHRGDLQQILLGAVQQSGGRIFTSRTVLGVDEAFYPRVLVRNNKNGKKVWLRADVVIAADGIQSTVRRQIGQMEKGSHHETPVATGDSAYRLLIPRERVQHDAALLAMLDQNVAMRYMGPGGHIMAYPVKQNSLYNIVLLHPTSTDTATETTMDTGGSPWTTQGSRTEMLHFYRNWSPAIRAWLSYADQDLLEWTLQTAAPLPHWARNSVALIGDACHPMLPYVAQGAANAIEDAAVLMTAFTLTSDVILALRVYEAVRKTRAEVIAASASSTGRSLHLPDGSEQHERDEAIRNAGKGLHTGAEDTSDKWRDPSWQDFMWGVDVMRETVENWEALTAMVDDGSFHSASKL